MSCAAAGAEPDCHAPDKQPDADRLEQIRELMDDLAEIESKHTRKRELEAARQLALLNAKAKAQLELEEAVETAEEAAADAEAASGDEEAGATEAAAAAAAAVGAAKARAAGAVDLLAMLE